ncbi:MAG: hypothetical protein QOE90_3154 [Thermoplasmata archaeon]|nr:hypothetical protein [Thermoplasmata archaeon]
MPGFPSASHQLSPLWVIGLFVALVEGVFAYALTTTTGAVQWASLLFAMFFATGVAACFFLILWKNNKVFYTPADFKDTDVNAYAQAMARSPADGGEILDEMRRSLELTLTSSDTLEALAGPGNASAASAVMRHAIEQVTANVRETAFLAVDATPLLGPEAGGWLVPWSKETTCADFLDDLWARLSKAHARLPPFTYGRRWALRANGAPLPEMGTRWAEEHGMERDTRLLSEVGIAPGAHLEVVRPQRAPPREKDGQPVAVR